MQSNSLVLCNLSSSRASFLQPFSDREVVAKKNSKYSANQLDISLLHENWNVCPNSLCDAPAKKEAHVGYLWKSIQNEPPLVYPTKYGPRLVSRNDLALKVGWLPNRVTVNRWFWSIFSFSFYRFFLFCLTLFSSLNHTAFPIKV